MGTYRTRDKMFSQRKTQYGLPWKWGSSQPLQIWLWCFCFHWSFHLQWPLAGCLKGMAVSQKIAIFGGWQFTMMLHGVLFGLKIRFYLVQIRRWWARLVLSSGFGIWRMPKSNTTIAIMGFFSLLRNIPRSESIKGDCSPSSFMVQSSLHWTDQGLDGILFWPFAVKPWCGFTIASRIAYLALLHWNYWQSQRRQITVTSSALMCGAVWPLSLTPNYKTINGYPSGISLLVLVSFGGTRMSTCILWQMCVIYLLVIFLHNFMSSLMISLRQWSVMGTMAW